MWNVIMMRYQLHTSTEVGDHFRQLYRKQDNDEKIQENWVPLTIGNAYLLSARRHVDTVVSWDIVKDNKLSVHKSWSPFIDSLGIAKAQLEELSFTRRVHVETKVSAA